MRPNGSWSTTPALARARLALLAATRQVLRNGFAVLGVRAPDSMCREADPTMTAIAHGSYAQRGGFVMGLIVGLLVGLALALGVALYVTKAPVPFVNKVPQRTPEQDAAEVERNKNWDPNAPLGQQAGRAAPAGTPPPASSRPAAGHRAGAAAAASAAPHRRRAHATRPRSCRRASRRRSRIAPQSAKPGADPFIYFVQAGAFSTAEDARGSSAPSWRCSAHAAKVTEREQSGRMMYRVRLGPFQERDEAEAAQGQAASARRDRGAGARAER